MIENNPYQSPLAAEYIAPDEREWKGGADAVLARRGLLQRKVIINRPISVTIEYFARGIRDRIILDGTTAVSLVPIFRLHRRFDFRIPCRHGDLPATVRLETEPRSLRLRRFEIEIDGVVAYAERNGHPA